MAFFTSPITGGAITGFTAPTYTITADYPPNSWSQQFAVTAIGGTQAGVDTTSTVSRPWTLTVSKPQNMRQLNAVDSNNVLRSLPRNTFGTLLRKGLTVLSGQPSQTALFRAEFVLPAGSDTADAPNIKGAVSCFVGALSQATNNLVTLFTTGVMT